MGVNLSREKKRQGGKGAADVPIAEGQGRAIYEAMLQQRHESGHVWTTTDLIAAVRAAGGSKSQTNAARWIGGQDMTAANAKRLARILHTTTDALLKPDFGEIYLINLPHRLRMAIEQGYADPPALARGLEELANDVRMWGEAAAARAEANAEALRSRGTG